jgi:hypothetical protein
LQSNAAFGARRLRGDSWKGQDRRYYRAGNRRISAQQVDMTVLEQVGVDLNSREFTRRILERVQANAGGQQLTEAQKLRTAAATIERRISEFMDMAANLDTPGPVLRKVDELERDRIRIEGEIAVLQREAKAAREAKALTEESVAERLNSLAEGAKRYDRDELKHFLSTLLSGVALGVGSAELQIHYKIELRRGLKMASPTGFEPVLPP